MKTNQQTKETRAFQTQFKVETRTEDEEKRVKVEGYAAVFNSETELYGLRESIDPGAFAEALESSDVRALFNHDANMLLARTGSGTLKLSVDQQGLKYEFDLPDTQLGRDLGVLMERGDLAESSFAFTVSDEEWRDLDKDIPLRVIKKIDKLFDVAPVTYPAYADTTVALRSKPDAPEPTPNLQEKRERQLKLAELNLTEF